MYGSRLFFLFNSFLWSRPFLRGALCPTQLGVRFAQLLPNHLFSMGFKFSSFHKQMHFEIFVYSCFQGCITFFVFFLLTVKVYCTRSVSVFWGLRHQIIGMIKPESVRFNAELPNHTRNLNPNPKIRQWYWRQEDEDFLCSGLLVAKGKQHSFYLFYLSGC